jgi:hypothetical protein
VLRPSRKRPADLPARLEQSWRWRMRQLAAASRPTSRQTWFYGRYGASFLHLRVTKASMPFPQRLMLVAFPEQGLPFEQKVHHLLSGHSVAFKNLLIIDWKSMAQFDWNAHQLVSGVGPSPKFTDCPRQGSHLSGLHRQTLLISLLWLQTFTSSAPRR